MLLVDLVRLGSRIGLFLNILVLGGGGLGLELIRRGILLLPGLSVVGRGEQVKTSWGRGGELVG
jgi:hypothetical protein